jgi:hypothetical protein
MTATAKVKFEVEIMLFQGWGLGCSIEQVRDQARKEAKRKLLATLETDKHIKIVGEPTVTMILVPIQ